MDIEKHLIITGSSEVSWKDAIVKAISEASKSIDYCLVLRFWSRGLILMVIRFLSILLIWILVFLLI